MGWLRRCVAPSMLIVMKTVHCPDRETDPPPATNIAAPCGHSGTCYRLRRLAMIMHCAQGLQLNGLCRRPCTVNRGLDLECVDAKNQTVDRSVL